MLIIYIKSANNMCRAEQYGKYNCNYTQVVLCTTTVNIGNNLPRSLLNDFIVLIPITGEIRQLKHICLLHLNNHFTYILTLQKRQKMFITYSFSHSFSGILSLCHTLSRQCYDTSASETVSFPIITVLHWLVSF